MWLEESGAHKKCFIEGALSSSNICEQGYKLTFKKEPLKGLQSVELQPYSQILGEARREQST
jgi:hypothetical protein